MCREPLDTGADSNQSCLPVDVDIIRSLDMESLVKKIIEVEHPRKMYGATPATSLASLWLFCWE